MSFVDILSGEVLPRPPTVEDPEIDKFNRDMIDYLRRFAGRFTDENLGISQEGIFFDYDDTFSSHTGDTSKTVLKTVAIPGKTLTNGRSLKIEAFGHTTSAPATFSLHLDFGSSTLTEGLTQTLSANTEAWYMTAYIQWLTDTSQKGFGTWQVGVSGALLVQTPASTSESSVADLNLTLAITLASDTDTVGCDLFLVKSIGDALALPRGR